MATKPVPVHPPGLTRCGPTRPAKPTSAFAEDFALLIRAPARLRIRRGITRILN